MNEMDMIKTWYDWSVFTELEQTKWSAWKRNKRNFIYIYMYSNRHYWETYFAIFQLIFIHSLDRILHLALDHRKWNGITIITSNVRTYRRFSVFVHVAMIHDSSSKKNKSNTKEDPSWKIRNSYLYIYIFACSKSIMKHIKCHISSKSS